MVLPAYLSIDYIRHAICFVGSNPYRLTRRTNSPDHAIGGGIDHRQDAAFPLSPRAGRARRQRRRPGRRALSGPAGTRHDWGPCSHEESLWAARGVRLDRPEPLEHRPAHVLADAPRVPGEHKSAGMWSLSGPFHK